MKDLPGGRRGRVAAILAVLAMLAAMLSVAVSAPAAAQSRTCFGEKATIVAQAGEVTVGTPGDDVIVGTSGPDDIRGRGGDDRICGRGGDDKIRGNAGNDRIKGGKGADEISGGKGRDLIRGQSGNDTLKGNRGRDEISGGKGNDTIRGGARADTLEGNRGRDEISGGKGNDSIRGGARADTLEGNSGRDDISGGKGNDTIEGGAARDVLRGNSGDDTINARDGVAESVWCGTGAADVATVDDADQTFSCETVRRPFIGASVFDIALDPAEAWVAVGETVTLVATPIDEAGDPVDREVTWASSDDDVATVTPDGGLVTGVALGNVTITATSEGVSKLARITVHRPVVRVEIADPGMRPVEIGSTLQLSATAYDSDSNVVNVPIAWSSSDDGIATVTPEGGLVTGVARGTVRITATAAGKYSAVDLRVVGEGTTEGGNNLSWPVVFAEGIGMSGAKVTDENELPDYLGTGLRPMEAEGIVVDELPFFHDGNEPDNDVYHEQQGENVWQASWADGVPLGERSVEAKWGDNLTHRTWDTHTMIRVEVVLSDLDIDELPGYVMTYLSGQGPTEMQGTDGTVADFVPTVYAVTPRLVVSKLDAEGNEIIETVLDQAIWEGSGEGPGSFSAEVNVAGKVIFGYNFFIKNIVLETPDAHKWGWWRLSFELDETATIAGESIARNLKIDVVTGEGDGELTYAPERAEDGRATSLDIYVEKASH